MKFIALSNGQWAMSIILLALLFGCAAKEKEEVFELKLSKMGSSDYLTIELKGDTLYSESLPSPMAAVAPRMEMKNISGELKELKEHIKEHDFFSWKNETEGAADLVTIEITLGNKHNIVQAEIGKESSKFKDFVDEIIELAEPRYS